MSTPEITFTEEELKKLKEKPEEFDKHTTSHLDPEEPAE